MFTYYIWASVGFGLWGKSWTRSLQVLRDDCIGDWFWGDEKDMKIFFPVGKMYLQYSSIKLKLNRKTSSLWSRKRWSRCRWFWSTGSFSWPLPFSVKVLHPFHLSWPSLSFTVRENVYTCRSAAAHGPEYVKNKIKTSGCRGVFEIPNVWYENSWTHFWQPV